MLTKAYLLIRDGDIMGAVCDQLSWLILWTGLFLMPFVPGSIGKDIALMGAAIIVLFGGRDKKGIVSRLIGGVLSLYNISGYLSDLLSYSRIFALGVATGVIAMVINTVAQMLIAAGPVGTARRCGRSCRRSFLQYHHQHPGCFCSQLPAAVH